MFRLFRITLASALIGGAIVVAFSPAIASTGAVIATVEVLAMATGATAGLVTTIVGDRRKSTV